MIDCRFVPLERWPKKATLLPTRARFKATWTAVLDLLEYELEKLKAKDIIIEAAFTREDIRNDGWPRSTARPSKSAVIVSFTGKHGPASFPCDTFDHWQANIHAIAKSLEALRMVDRYGVTMGGEQYRGFTALPPPEGTPLTRETAAALIAKYAGGFDASQISRDAEYRDRAWRAAVVAVHPDKPGGNAEIFKQVQAARELLDREDATP